MSQGAVLSHKHPFRAGYLSVLAAVPIALSNLSVCAADSINEGLLACAKLGDDAERLTCFDRLAAQLHENRARPAAPTSAAPTSAAPLSAAPADMFGLTTQNDAPHTQPPVTRTSLNSIHAHVVSLREIRSGTILELDNGQKWQQMGREDLLLKTGDGVKITRGAFNSFWVMTDGNRSGHVKRIN
jgi:hypothetical protein